MKARDLRIGNYVNGLYGGIMKVAGIKVYTDEKCDVWLKKPDYSISGVFMIDTINPIKLTEEWFLKFGFNYGRISGNFVWFTKPVNNKNHHGVFKIIVNPETGFFLNERVMVRLEYVHQLQNLYFVLTGEELKETKISKNAKA